MSDKIKVLAEYGNEVLLKIEKVETLGNFKLNTVRHEWWTDREMMKKGIHGDKNGNIFCRGYAGSNDDNLISQFMKRSE